MKSPDFNEDRPPSVIRLLSAVEQMEAKALEAERLMAEQRQALDKLVAGYADLKTQLADLKRAKFFSDLETHNQASDPFCFVPEAPEAPAVEPAHEAKSAEDQNPA